VLHYRILVVAVVKGTSDATGMALLGEKEIQRCGSSLYLGNQKVFVIRDSVTYIVDANVNITAGRL